MFLNLATGCLGMGSLPLDERIRLACSHNFAGIDVPLDGIDTEADAVAVGRKIQSAGLECGLFWLPCDLSSADDMRFAACLQWAEKMASLAASIGLRRTYCHIWPGSDDRNFDANFQWHLRRIVQLRDILFPAGIEFGLEFLGPRHLHASKRHRFIHDLDGVLKLISAAGEGVGLVFDTYHWYCSGGTLDGLKQKLADVRIVNVHLNDAHPHIAPPDQQDGWRLLPAESGVIPVRKIIQILSDLNYRGPVIAEPFSPWIDRFKAMPKDDVAALVAKRTLPLLDGLWAR